MDLSDVTGVGTATELPQLVARQVRDELTTTLVDPVGMLLGLDLADTLRQRLTTRALLLADQACQDADDKLAASTVNDLMQTLWPHGDPEPRWWRTPLGRVCARSLGADDAEAVTYSVAAAMLGVTKGTVSQLVARGKLDRHPDGGLTRASVLVRLAQPEP